MSRPIFRWAAILQIGLVLFTGCHPTQPFFVARDESLASYLAQSMDIEYADVHIESLPEATQAMIPFGANNLPTSFLDLTLEDCISITLQNSKIIRVTNGSNQQSGSTSAALLSASPGQMPSVYDPAQIATTANTQPPSVDSQGNRVAPRGAARSNQVGGVEDALSEFDAQFSALLGYNTTDRPRNVGPGNIFNPQFFQALDSNAQAALSKRMATGTIATARFTTVYSRNNIPSPGVGRSVPSDYTVAAEMQITQPLLRGRGTLVNRIPIVLARINEDIQLHEFEMNIRNLVKSVEDAYWDLHGGYRALETARDARESALRVWRYGNALDSIGRFPPEAEAQARAQYYQFETQIHVSLYGSPVPGNDPRGLYGREQILREKMGWSPTDGRMIRPTDEPTIARIQFDWADIQGEALNRNVDLRRQKWAIKQRELELISAKNQILPQLDVTAFYRWLGVGDTLAESQASGIQFPNQGSNALEGLLDGDYQEIGARLELTPQPLGKRRALLGIQNAHINIKKSHEELREKEMALMQELSFAWRSNESTFTTMKDYLDQWQANEDEIRVYAEKRDKQTENNENEIRQLLDNLLRAEERRARAQLLYYQSVVEYNKSIVNIHYLKGSLLDLNSVSLEEGAWVDKAYWDAEERASERASGNYFDYGYTRPGVVSNGPVETGGPTQGNLPQPGSNSRVGRPDGSPEEVKPAEGEPEKAEGDDRRELRPLPERGAPSASNLPNSLRNNNSGNVRQASGGEGFDWGGLGINDGSSTRYTGAPPSEPNANRPVRVISSGGQNTTQANSPNWKPR